MKTVCFYAIVTAFIAFCFCTPAISNLYAISMEKEYKIPFQSSVFTFNPTKMNEGSGDWWVYGEDKHYFYANTQPIKSIDKTNTKQNPHFNPWDHTTW